MSKVILVTGASYGLGEVLLKRFSNRKDYKVAGIARTIKEEENENILLFKGDITCKKDVDLFFKAVADKWGGFDILINNAGIVGDFKEIEKYSEEEIDALINVNIKAAFMVSQKAVQLINKPGYIINIGSTRSITGAPNKSLYTMSKFALRGLTQSINSELKSKGIYSTIVCPGSFKTVPLDAIAGIIENLISLDISAHVPEVIIGGML